LRQDLAQRDGPGADIDEELSCSSPATISIHLTKVEALTLHVNRMIFKN
jgi:hypothetical protein